MTVMIGVDIGGTKIAVAPVNRAGRILAEPVVQHSITTSSESFVDGLLATLREALHRFSAYEPKAIGIACAGTVDASLSTVITSPNLPIRMLPLATLLQQQLGLGVVVENDANAAMLAEAVVGAARGTKNAVMLTLGTGVGGGLWLNGEIYRGAGGGAAELGHVIVCGCGEPCACGSAGCLEMYASGKALARFAEGRAGDSTFDPRGKLQQLLAHQQLDGAAVGKLALEGYPGALAAAGELAIWLGRGLIGLTNTFNPEMIVIGGGVAELGEVILAPARQMMLDFAMEPNRSEVRIVAAHLGNEAGIVGGALTARRTFGVGPESASAGQ